MCLSIDPNSDLRPELTESAFSVTVYLILALPQLSQTYQLLLSVCGHQYLFHGNYGDIPKPVFVKILKKQLALLIHTLNSCFPIFTFLFVIVQFGFVGIVCGGHHYITLKYYSQTYVGCSGQEY